jgi:hypothetical protein
MPLFAVNIILTLLILGAIYQRSVSPVGIPTRYWGHLCHASAARFAAFQQTRTLLSSTDTVPDTENVNGVHAS